MWQQLADGTGEPRVLWRKSVAAGGFVSPDGRWLVLGTPGSPTAPTTGDIVAARVGDDTVARPLVASGFDEQGASLSPDSRWLAYISNEQGEHEVFVRPFPNVNDGKWQISREGGSAPVWSRDGRELFYVGGSKMQAVAIHPGAIFTAEPPRALFEIPERVRAGSLAGGTFAVTPDGQRFLMVRDESWAEMAGMPMMVVVENFFEELRSKLKK